MRAPRADGGAVALELRLFATFREAVGQKVLTRRYRQPVSVGDVLEDLETSYPDLDGALLDGAGSLRPSVSVIRNGRHIAHFDGLDTVLDDGDTLGVMPPVSGGGGVRLRDRTDAGRSRGSSPGR